MRPDRFRLLVVASAALLLVLAALAGYAAWQLGAGAGQRIEFGGTTLGDPQAVGAFRLVNEDGARVDESALQGSWTLVFFGYSECPDICSPTLAKLAQTYRSLGAPQELGIVMITVDPDRDTPAVLTEYTDRFAEVVQGWTGSPAEIATAASRFYVASVAGPDGTLSHTSAVMLVDPEGRMRVVYGQDSLDAIEDDLRQLGIATDRA